MLNGIETTIVGNLADTPDLRFTPAGLAVCNLSIAVNPRVRNNKGEWVQSETIWVRCAVWRDEAENVAESFSKGDRIMIAGELKMKSWTDTDDVEHSYLEMSPREIGASVKFATAKVSRLTRKSDEDEQEPEPEEEKPLKRPTRKPTSRRTTK